MSEVHNIYKRIAPIVIDEVTHFINFNVPEEKMIMSETYSDNGVPFVIAFKLENEQLLIHYNLADPKGKPWTFTAFNENFISIYPSIVSLIMRMLTDKSRLTYVPYQHFNKYIELKGWTIDGWEMPNDAYKNIWEEHLDLDKDGFYPKSKSTA